MPIKKLLTVTSAVCVLSVLPMHSVQAHGDHGKPQFGGVIAEAGEIEMEIVGKNDTITVHLSIHGSPIDSAGATGKLTLLEGGKKSDLALTPAGANRMTASGRYSAGTKLLLQVQLPGQKPLQARTIAK